MPARTRLLPLLPLRDICVMPGTLGEAQVGRAGSLRAIEQALKGGRTLFVAIQKDPELSDPLPRDLYPIGTIARLEARIDLQRGGCRVVLSGIDRARLVGRGARKQQITAGVEEIEEPIVPRTSERPPFRKTIEHVVRASVAGEEGREKGLFAVERERALGRWCDRLCPVVLPAWADWIRVLQVVDPIERAATLGAVLAADLLGSRGEGRGRGGRAASSGGPLAGILGEARANELVALATRSSAGREGRIRALSRFLLSLQRG